MYYLLSGTPGVDNAGALLANTHRGGCGGCLMSSTPRNTFAECIDAMKKDFEIAMKHLPTEYGEEYYSEAAQKYPA